MNRISTVLLLAASSWLQVPAGFAQWTRTIDCPQDRIYRDRRNDVGGEEFCEHVLPGALVVKDGPFRFWYNRNFQGAAGNYVEGRKVGAWKECDRFGRCQERQYPPSETAETSRPGFKPEIPVSFAGGKYVFDFASCRSTWVTLTEGNAAVLELNILGYDPASCEVNYLPESFIEHGGEGSYTCRIPYSAGKKELASLDLMSELPKLGLPQLCNKPILMSGPGPVTVDPSFGEGQAQIFTAEFSTPKGGSDIAQARLHFQASAASRTNRCVVRYDPGTKRLYLLSDEPGKYLGPIAAGGNDSLWNSRCLLSGCSTAEVSGTTLTVHFAVRFNPAEFAERHRIFLELVDSERHASPAGDAGTWTVPPLPSGTQPPAWPADRSCPAATK